MKKYLTFGLCLLAFPGFSAYADTILTATDKQQISGLIEHWNDNYNQYNDGRALTIYAGEVEWFGKKLSAQQVIANEKDFLNKNPEFGQKILGRLRIMAATFSDSQSEPLSADVRFVKQVELSNGWQQNYPAQFTVQKLSQGWRITEETDGITRHNQDKSDDEEVVKGKFDGQHVSYVWMSEANPKTGDECTEDTDCESFLWSSDPKVNPVKVSNHLMGNLTMLTQLDDSGRDRVVVHSLWWDGGWLPVYLYDIQHGQWIRDIPVIPYNVNIEETVADSELIKRDPNNVGQINVMRAVLRDTDDDDPVTTEVVTYKLLELK